MSTGPYDNALEQRAAAQLGIWAFLATEVLFFGPLFFGYVHGRAYQNQAFVAGSHSMHIVLGTLNTAVLLTSSLTMVLGVRAAAAQQAARLRTFLAVTAALGVVFLCIKGYEYGTEASHAAAATGGEAQFYFLYYAMTGLHALHLALGIAILAWLWIAARRARSLANKVEIAGLYWHFIDIIWVFLYPMFYLLERYR